MRCNVQLVSTAIVLANLALCPVAHAADPSTLQVAPPQAQGGSIGRRDAPGSPAVRSPLGIQNSPLGIDADPSNNTAGDTALVAPPLPNSSPPDFGLFPQIGKTLLERGIDFHGVFLDHFLANPTSGVERGHTSNLGILIPRVDLDLGKLVGINGGYVHIGQTIFLFKSGLPDHLTQFGGVLGGYQTLPSPVSNTLSLFTYEQRLFNDRLSIEVGRTNLYNYFLIPNSLDLFNQFSSTFFLTSNSPTIVFPTWGGRATYRLTPTWYVQAGAFADNIERGYNNGYVLGTNLARGAQIIGEVAYRSEFSNARYPANMEIGVEYNTRHGYSTIRGTSIRATPQNTAANYPGGAVLFSQGQQVIYRGADNNPGLPPANIAVYGAAAASLGKPQPIDLDAMLGVNFTGVLPWQRPYDALGIQARYQRLSKVEADFETFAQNLVAGPGRSQPRDGFSFEIIADIGVAPFAKLSPFVQYFVDSDQYFNPFQRNRARDGFAAGVTLSVSLGRLLGTSQKPF